MTDQEKKEWRISFIIGLILGVFITWQVYFTWALYQWVNRPSGVLHNYLEGI